MKSDVLSRKRILVNDPSIKTMTDTQWLFELEGVHALEERRYEEFTATVQLVKKGVINLLGLNLMPMHEELSEEEKLAFAKAGALDEDSYRLRRATEDEFIPLVILTGREEMVAEIIKKNRELQEQDDFEASSKKVEFEISSEELDEITKKDLDVPEFINNPKDLEKFIKWNKSESTKKAMEALVQSVSDRNKGNEEAFVKSSRGSSSKPVKRSKVIVE